MSLEEIALVAEIVGAVAIIATLFYLAVQIRQNSRVVRSDVREKRTSTAQTMLLKLADEAELFQKLGSGDELSETEQLRADFYHEEVCHLLLLHHLQQNRCIQKAEILQESYSQS